MLPQFINKWNSLTLYLFVHFFLISYTRGDKMRKLTRSKKDRVFFGVCGGLAEYFNINSTIVRLSFIVLSLISFGAMVIAYIICAIIIPESNEFVEADTGTNYEYNNSMKYLGIALVIIGLLLFAKILSYEFGYVFLNVKKLWPILLVLAGIYLVVKKDSAD